MADKEEETKLKLQDFYDKSDDKTKEVLDAVLKCFAEDNFVTKGIFSKVAKQVKVSEKRVENIMVEVARHIGVKDWRTIGLIRSRLGPQIITDRALEIKKVSKEKEKLASRSEGQTKRQEEEWRKSYIKRQEERQRHWGDYKEEHPAMERYWEALDENWLKLALGVMHKLDGCGGRIPDEFLKLEETTLLNAAWNYDPEKALWKTYAINVLKLEIPKIDAEVNWRKRNIASWESHKREQGSKEKEIYQETAHGIRNPISKEWRKRNEDGTYEETFTEKYCRECDELWRELEKKTEELGREKYKRDNEIKIKSELKLKEMSKNA